MITIDREIDREIDKQIDRNLEIEKKREILLKNFKFMDIHTENSDNLWKYIKID